MHAGQGVDQASFLYKRMRPGSIMMSPVVDNQAQLASISVDLSVELAFHIQICAKIKVGSKQNLSRTRV